MKTNKYPNGYQAKVQFYTGKVLAAIEFNDYVELSYALRKLEYFGQKHVEYLDKLGQEAMKVDQETNTDNIPY